MSGLRRRSHQVMFLILAIGIMTTTAACRKKGKLSGSGSDATYTGFISISPQDVAIEKGEKVELTATATGFSETEINVVQSEIQFQWTGCDPSLAETEFLAQVAKVRGTSPGQCVITVSAGGFEAASITVVVKEPTLTGVQIAPTDTVGKLGGSVDFTAFANYSDGSSKECTGDVTWSADPSEAVAFDAKVPGRAGIRLKGTTKIRAETQGFAGEAKLVVPDARLIKLIIIPELKPNLMGSAQQFFAVGVSDNGSTTDLTKVVSWSSSNTSVATIDNGSQKGFAALLSAGSTSVKISYNGLTAETPLVVASPVLTALKIQPALAQIAVGFTQKYTLTGTYSDGTSLDLTSAASWSSADTTVVEVSNAGPTRGMARGIAAGTRTITASVIGSSTEAVAAVTPSVVSSLSVTPTAVSVAPSETVQLTAGGTFSDGTFLDVTHQAEWVSTDSSALVENAAPGKGLVKGVHSGSAEVKATLSGLTASSSVTVTEREIVSLAISPSDASVKPGQQLQLKATATFDDASTGDYTNVVEWSSSNPEILVAIDVAAGKGSIVGVSVGTANITARYGNVAKTIPVEVKATVPSRLVSIAVTPNAATISAGAQVQFIATGYYNDLTTANVTNSVTWTSSDASVADFTASAGLLQGLANGVANIQAKISGVKGTGAIVVTSDQPMPPTPLNLAVSALSTTSLSASWQSGGGSTADYVYAYVPGLNAPVDCQTGTTGSALTSPQTLTGLTPGSWYTLILCARNADTAPDLSSPTASVTMATKPVAPVLTANVSGATQVTLYWALVTGADSGYKIAYQSGNTAPANCDTGTGVTAGNSDTSVTVTGLAASTQYSFVICAINSSSGASAPSAPVSASTPNGSVTFNSGSGNFTVPMGVTSIFVTMWGAGGGGGSGSDGGSNAAATGGGGGAFCGKTLTVIPGDILSYSVGAGGAGGVYFNGTEDAGDAGGASTLTYNSITYSAGGGPGGITGGPAISGGLATNCDDNRSGGGAADNFGSSGSGGGSSAAPGSDGVASTSTSGAIAPAGGGNGGNGGPDTFPGLQGGFPGGGGGGGGKHEGSGGDGASGQIKLAW